MKCPICDSNKTKELINLDCGEFDRSSIYTKVKIIMCGGCGHIYNKLTPDEIINLDEYYTEVYALLELEALDDNGFRPGSSNPLSIKRYEDMLRMISPHINKGSRILDVGCALGGFVNFLHNKGFKDVYGIDIIDKFVDAANDKKITIGSAYSIPFEDDSFDLIVLSHVFEHLTDLKSPFEEIKRVLVDDGLLYIEVPDAAGYDNLIFWLSIKEHIQHFDLLHLKLLCGIGGFEVIDSKESIMPSTDESISPIITTLSKREKKMTEVNFKRLDRQLKKLDILNSLVETERPIYCYGIGREFSLFYNNTELKEYKKLYLIDDTPSKQREFTIDGREILDSSVLKDATEDSILVIIPSLHKKVMRKKIIKDYYGEIIDF